MSNFLSLDVPDPTDFAPNSRKHHLRDLDASFRCTICSEFFDGPVTLACGHCFCSYCIRNHIVDTPLCPSCREKTSEEKIRSNPVMAEAVSAWKASRPFVLSLSKSKTEEAQTPQKKKRKLSSVDESEEQAGSSKTLKTSKTPQRQEQQEDDDDEIQILDPPPIGFVPCPICSKHVKEETINGHLDSCISKPKSETAATRTKPTSRAEQWAFMTAGKGKGKKKDSSPDESEERLAKAAYNTLKDKQLKNLLIECELPVNGDRQAWANRHQQYVVIHNANLDRDPSQRKTPNQLRAQLKQWEEQKKVKKKAVGDPVLYQKTYKNEFANLVEAARITKSLDSAPNDSSNGSSQTGLKTTRSTSTIPSSSSSAITTDEATEADDSANGMPVE